ncbi:MAG: hypothetical protein AAGB93_11135 [Planctomycetota bacterium]
MAKVPKRGSNVVHRLDFQSKTVRRSTPRRRSGGGFRPSLLPGGAASEDPHARPLEGRERRLEQVPQPAPAPAAAPQSDREVERLQRRLAKLTKLLDERDDELLALAEQGGGEDGIASIYRKVQGIQGRGKDAKRKKEFMTRIFEANLALRDDPGPTAAAE